MSFWINFGNFQRGQKWFFSLKIKRNREIRLYIYSSIKVYKNTFVWNLVIFYENSCLSTQLWAVAFISNIFEGFKSEFFPLKSEFRLNIYSSIKVYKKTFIYNLVIFYENSCLSTQVGADAFISNIFDGLKSELLPLNSLEISNFGFIYTRLSKSIKISLFLI